MVYFKGCMKENMIGYMKGYMIGYMIEYLIGCVKEYMIGYMMGYMKRYMIGHMKGYMIGYMIGCVIMREAYADFTCDKWAAQNMVGLFQEIGWRCLLGIPLWTNSPVDSMSGASRLSR